MKKQLCLIVIVLSLFIVMNSCASMATIANSLTVVQPKLNSYSENTSAEGG